MSQNQTTLESYLGNDPDQIPDTTDSKVLRGNGNVAKLFSPELAERERSVLELAAGGFPVRVPKLVDSGISWVVTREVPHDTGPWSDNDLEQALRELGRLHEAFTGGDVLQESWLRRPLDQDLDLLLSAARTTDSLLEPKLKDLLRDPSEIVDFLNAQPSTLLHGDPFPRNVLRAERDVDLAEVTVGSGDSRLVWIDWCHASVGPAAADLASWLDQTPWEVDRPIDRLSHIDAYLSGWQNPPERTSFLKALDASRVLWFFAYDLPNLQQVADSKPELVAKINEEASRAYEAFLRA